MSDTFHIFHSNDFHNHLTEQQAATIKMQRGAIPNALLVDSGDAISAGNIGVRPGGEPILETMTELGYDAMTLGNREFHVADTLLRTKIGKAGFPILCANMRWREDRGDSLPVLPHIRKEVLGVRIGIFGLTVPMVTSRMAARVVSATLFDDPVETAKAQIAELRGDVDLLIALTHIGIREDERLATACPELDLIIGGHSHVVLEALKWVGEVPIAQAGWFGHYLGHIEVDGFGECDRLKITGGLIDLR